MASVRKQVRGFLGRRVGQTVIKKDKRIVGDGSILYVNRDGSYTVGHICLNSELYTFRILFYVKYSSIKLNLKDYIVTFGKNRANEERIYIGEPLNVPVFQSCLISFFYLCGSQNVVPELVASSKNLVEM